MLPGGGGGQTDGSSTSNSSSATSRLEPAPRLEVSSGELAGIIVAVVLVTLLCVTVAVWLLRRKKNKSQTLSMELNHHQPPSTISAQLNMVVMETDVKGTASRQSSLSSNGGPPSFRSITEEPEEDFTDYGSVMESGSFPPSPTLSFRSVFDGPGISRSRTGTGTSFGTVASFNSDWTRRSRASTNASFKTCVEEDINNPSV